MEEYFCPNCGATLNNQYGFDPEKGLWTCEVCGKELYGEALEDTMNRFKGVVWYCDQCGACLNKQSGFDDMFSSWTCSECGYENRIDESEIYGSEAEYEASQYSYDYNSKDEDDTYSYKSAEDYDSHDGDYDSDDVNYDSDNYDYSSDDSYEEVYDDDEDDEEYSENFSGSPKPYVSTSSVDNRKYVQNNVDQSSTSTVNNTTIYEAPETPKNEHDVEIAKIREKGRESDKKHQLIRFGIVFGILLLVFLTIAVFSHYSSLNHERNYSEFVSTLQSYIADEKYEEAEQLIGHAKVDGWSYNDRDNWPAEKEKYLVEIEEKRAQSTGIPIKTLAVPRSASDFKHMNYADVVNELTDAGFIRVHYAEAGEKANLIHRADSVQRVSIDGETDFDEGDQFSKVAKIVVYYYAEESN